MAAEGAVNSFAKLNLSAIKKGDQYVVNIIDNASQVALYKFNGEKQVWVSSIRRMVQIQHDGNLSFHMSFRFRILGERQKVYVVEFTFCQISFYYGVAFWSSY